MLHNQVRDMFQRHLMGITAAQFVWEPLEEEAIPDEGGVVYALRQPRLPLREFQVTEGEMLHKQRKECGTNYSRTGRRMKP